MCAASRREYRSLVLAAAKTDWAIHGSWTKWPFLICARASGSKSLGLRLGCIEVLAHYGLQASCIAKKIFHEVKSFSSTNRHRATLPADVLRDLCQQIYPASEGRASRRFPLALHPPKLPRGQGETAPCRTVLHLIYWPLCSSRFACSSVL